MQAPPSFSSLVTRGPTPTMTDILHGELGTAQDKVSEVRPGCHVPHSVFFVVARNGGDPTATYLLGTWLSLRDDWLNFETYKCTCYLYLQWYGGVSNKEV